MSTSSIGNTNNNSGGFFNFNKNSNNKSKTEGIANKKIKKEDIKPEKLQSCNTIDVIGNAHIIVKKVLAEINGAFAEDSELLKNLSDLMEKLGAQASLLLTGTGENDQPVGLAPGAIQALQKGIANWVIEWCGKANVKEDEPIANLLNQAFANATESVVQGAAKGLEAAIMKALVGEAERVAKDAPSGNVIVEEEALQPKTLIKAINNALNDILQSNITRTAQVVSKILFNDDVTSKDRGMGGALQEIFINEPLERVNKYAVELVKPYSEAIPTLLKSAEDLNATLAEFSKVVEPTNKTLEQVAQTLPELRQTMCVAVQSFLEIARSIEETRQKVDDALPTITKSIERIGFLAEAIARVLNGISDFFAKILRLNKEIPVESVPQLLVVNNNDQKIPES
ncbi:MAG: hypothetical protein V4494_00505 [Chlamydiota bacterium]